MTRKALIVVLPVLLAACGGAGEGPSFDAPVDDGVEEAACETCASHSECDDGVACTVDTCVIGGCCEHLPDDDECADGEICDPVDGCVASECTTNADCDDGLDCTTDTCLIDHTCANDDTCPGDQVCTATGCEGPPPSCTSDVECQEADGVFCNGDEWCDPEFGCRPAENPRECIDSDPCTDDACDPILDMCTFTCNPDISGCTCPFDPYPGCFGLGTTIQQRCALGYVDYSFSQVCFTVVGLSLQATVDAMTLSQVPAPDPTDHHFDVSTTVAGDCDEFYGIVGDFTDVDHFTGSWTATFTGGISCTMGGCTNQYIAITGTRIP